MSVRSWVERAGRASRRRVRLIPAPVGRLARDRRLLRGVRAALGDHVLVIGDPSAASRALRPASLDQLGSNPFDHRVTVLSDGFGVGSVPRGRWSGVVVVDPADQHAEAAADAARSACTSGGWVCVLRDESGRRILERFLVR